MRQQYALGQWLREEYADNGFVNGNYSRTQVCLKMPAAWGLCDVMSEFSTLTFQYRLFELLQAFDFLMVSCDFL